MPIEKLRPSFTFNEDRINELKKIAPEAFADGKINWEVLQEALGQYLEDDEAQEHFGLFWPGKRQARRMAAVPSKGTLVPVYGEGLKADGTPDSDGKNDSRNIFIEGENLEVLKILQKAYAGKIKMIYIDPPYNTGNDFVYDDNFTEPLQEYLRRTGQVDEEGQPLTTNKKADGRFHSKWLSMMYPRLRLARNLLRDDGVIFVSIDENEVHNLRAMMNEIFGEENFVAGIVWQRAFSPINLKKHFSESHDYILCYSKSISQLEDFGLKRDDKSISRYKNPDNDKRGQWTSGGIDVGPPIPEKIYPITTPSGRDVFPPNGYCWRYTKEKLNELIKDNRIWFGEKGNNVPRIKRFLSEVKDSITPMTLWLRNEVGDSQSAIRELKKLFDGKFYFEYPKPLGVIQRCIGVIKDTNNIILDFFAGACPTAHAALELNGQDGGMRKYICVQLPELCDEKSEAYKAGYKTIAEIGKERIRRVVKKIKEEGKKNPDIFSNEKTALDLGFKSYRLEFSNYKEWINYEATDSKKLETLFDQFETPLRESWTEQGLLTETMLIEGFPLDSSIERLAQFKANKIQKVTSEFCDHALLVCFDEKIYDATIGQLDLNEKDILICLDSAIADRDKLRLADKGLIKTI